MVRVDNIGDIFVASNINTTCHTMHENIRCKYVNKHAEDGVVRVIFVKSVDNDSNILTKSITAKLCEKHSRRMVGKKPGDVPIFKNI